MKIKEHIEALGNFTKNEAFSGILLFIATLSAIIVANSFLSQEYFDFWHLNLVIGIEGHSTSMTLTQWIDDGLMALFFLMVGLEIKRELLVGKLSSVEKASFPLVAALGGMVVPALIYVLFNTDNPRGFGVPMATDIAFALGVLMILGKRVNPSLKLFLVALAVADDLGAVMIVATVYTNEIHSEYFLYAGAVYALIILLNYKKVTSLMPYLLLGIALWIFIHSAGVHATIAGVLLAFAIPVRSSIKEKEFIKNTKDSINVFEKNIDKINILNHHQIDALEEISYNYDKVQNPLVKLEHQLHNLSAFIIMPLFAFSNAGVIFNFSAVSEHIMIVLGVVFGLLIGKPLGIVGFTYIIDKLKIIRKPDSLLWSEIIAVGFLGGIGFTMSIFVTQLAYLDENIMGAVKLGIFFASLLAGLIAVVLLLRVNKKQ